ncbi:unknown [Ruminococcus sp. CAG:382]|nr:unknown [Ruminococcus sp. CAG:382]
MKLDGGAYVHRLCKLTGGNVGIRLRDFFDVRTRALHRYGHGICAVIADNGILGQRVIRDLDPDGNLRRDHFIDIKVCLADALARNCDAVRHDHRDGEIYSALGRHSGDVDICRYICIAH